MGFVEIGCNMVVLCRTVILYASFMLKVTTADSVALSQLYTKLGIALHTVRSWSSWLDLTFNSLRSMVNTPKLQPD